MGRGCGENRAYTTILWVAACAQRGGLLTGPRGTPTPVGPEGEGEGAPRSPCAPRLPTEQPARGSSGRGAGQARGGEVRPLFK